MDAPKCRLCEKRHYGTCAGAVVPAEPRARKKSAGAKKKSKARGGDESGSSAPENHGWPGSGISKPVFEEVMARLESLEARVLELESRKRYMREYQRAKRAEQGEK